MREAKEGIVHLNIVSLNIQHDCDERWSIDSLNTRFAEMVMPMKLVLIPLHPSSVMICLQLLLRWCSWAPFSPFLTSSLITVSSVTVSVFLRFCILLAAISEVIFGEIMKMGMKVGGKSEGIEKR